MSICQHCGRPITYISGCWIDTQAHGDDGVWRETCDSHDTFTAEHEPTYAVCTAETGHLNGSDHRWQECPTYGEGS